jgi:hypothetical protein
MQIEEGFRDMKSTKFGLGYEQNKSVKKQRLTILVLLVSANLSGEARANQALA